MTVISVIVGSTREGRFSEKPAHWILQQLKKRPGVDARVLDRARHPRVLERHVFFEAELVHQTGDRRTTEATHQFVFQ